MFIENKIYIIEFKMDTNKENALVQIKNRGYAEKYINQGKDIYLVGINFNERDRNISGFEWEKF